MREHMARTTPRNESTIRYEVRMVRVRENGLDHRVSDDGVGSGYGVKIKKRGGRDLPPPREQSEQRPANTDD